MEWQPIETAPKDGTEFLARDATERDIARWDSGGVYGDDLGRHPFTHWAPLPDMPECSWPRSPSASVQRPVSASPASTPATRSS
jgi:hypothetical protein